MVKLPDHERRTCPDRGACLDHAGVTEKIENGRRRIQNIERQNFVPFSLYKWSIGIIISIFISLFSISIYLTFETKSELATISKTLERSTYKIEKISDQLEEVKRKIKKP